MRRLLFVVFVLAACSKAPSFNEPPPSDCTPACEGKACGIDGCGGQCGECSSNEVCAVGGVCVPECVPDCSNRNCAGDGCGGSCGNCTPPNPLCSPEGRCVDCLPDCTNRFCGDDGCGGTCGMCDEFSTCTSTGTCDCTATCGARVCGNVCDDFCGDCTAPEVCDPQGVCCTPDCAGRQCGDDGCGGRCDLCPAGQRCNEGDMCEDCGCGTDECSDDGCCGFCPIGPTAQLECSTSGLCTCNPGCMPDCVDRACGPDGCGGQCGSACGSTERCTFDPTMAPAVACRPFAGVSGEMNFFVSSEGNFPSGGNFGGLAGADALCQRLAAAVGAGGRTWVAYLSSATATAARDRIGQGPWRNAAGTAIVDPNCTPGAACLDLLHADNIPVGAIVSENGESLDLRNARVVYTGSDAMGRPTNVECQAWSSSDDPEMASGGRIDAAQAGGSARWNSGALVACEPAAAACGASRAHVYCFSP